MQHFGPNIVGPAASGKFPVVRCRGADSRARHSTNDLYQLPLKWKKLSTCHCEGALRPWQSREGTCSLYKLLLKRCAPIASVAALSERHAGQQHVAHGFCGVTPPELSLRGRFAPVAISQYPVGSWGSYRRNRSCLPEIATAPSGPRNDKSGYLKPWNPCQRNRNCLWRSLSAATFSLARWACAGNAATDAIGLYALSLPL